MAGSVVAAKKSARKDRVSLNVTLSANALSGPSLRVSGTIPLTISQARTLAHALVTLADAADAAASKEAARQARRKAWREREIAAGRMVVLRGFL